MIIYVNPYTKKLVDPENGYKPVTDENRPRFFYWTKDEIEAHFVDEDGVAVPVNSNDLFDFAADTNFLHNDDLMIETDSADVTITDAEEGVITIPALSNTTAFGTKADEENTEIHLEISRLILGDTVPSVTLQDKAYANPRVKTTEGTPESSDPEYYTAAQVDSLLSAKADKVGTSDIEITDAAKGIILRTAGGVRIRVTAKDDGGVLTVDVNQVT